MRVAILDLGTNSVRFDVHALGRGEKLLRREKRMIRLGQGVFLRGQISPAAIRRAVAAFRDFRDTADRLRVKRIVAFGTSALREAQNSHELVDAVREATGIEVQVISGKEEAKLIALGILEGEKKLPRGRYALVDIGGGSTEISLARGRQSAGGKSFPLGTARLQQLFLKRSPPRESAVEELRRYIRQRLKGHPRVGEVVASSGTAKALARLLGSPFSQKDLAALVERLATLSLPELLAVPGMEAKRADMIVAGSLLLDEILIALGAKRVHLTEFSLRDGLLEEERRLARAEKSSLIELHLEDLFARAARFGQDPARLRPMVEMAEQFFNRLRPVHQLEPRWKIYLLSAVILSGCGEIVGYAGREKHAYYIVKNADFPAMQGWEHEFIARLCLQQGGGKVGGLGSLGKDKKRREAYVKILALLRVLGALQQGAGPRVKVSRVTVGDKEVRVKLAGGDLAGMEQWLGERKKKLFREVFGRALYFEPSQRRKKG